MSSLGYSGLIVPVVRRELAPNTEDVTLFVFRCGHERLVAHSDLGKIGCLECERQFAPQMHKLQVSL